MRVRVDGVEQGEALPATSVTFAAGTATRLVVETEQRPSVLGLIATGRMRPSAGRVTIDGEADRGALRRRTALVDAPRVSDPDPAVPLAGVMAEELLFTGTRGGAGAVRDWATRLGVEEHLRTPIADVPPAVRVRVLVELAAARQGIEGLVLVSPDRHGGDPRDWWRLATEVAERGLAVLVLTHPASAAVLDAADTGSVARQLAAAAVARQAPDAHGSHRWESPAPRRSAEQPGADQRSAATASPVVPPTDPTSSTTHTDREATA